jgi:phosphoglycerate dehydrogenase-like enzyme
MPAIFIASPLEPEHVARIAAVDPSVEVIYEPDLLPATRYANDHKGHPIDRTGENLGRWRAGLARADILFDLPSAEDLPFATRLRWIQTTSTGVGPAVAALGLDRGDVLITTARGVHARPLAEFVFMALLAHFRGLARLQAEQRAHRWDRVCNDEIAGRTLVLLGAGDLARGCARIARALDMRTVAVTADPARPRAHADLFDEILPQSTLHQALARADALVITVPNTPLTERCIDAAALAALPPGAALVNIGRGTVVDEDALIAALRSGHLGYAALDVARTEPLPPDSPLWDMPNVLISPHSASTVAGENGRIVDIFAANLRCWLDGRFGEMRNVLDKHRLY